MATRSRLIIGPALAFVLSTSQTDALADAPVGRLLDLLAATPDGGWVAATTNNFSDAWATGTDAIPPSSTSGPISVIRAWSSFAWDSSRGDLLIFGGGHANYSGNEMYVWDGATGNWTRGSLPSRMEQMDDLATYLAVDRAAPASAHTYDNNLYLPVNDRFITFGGAAFNGGGGFTTNAAGSTSAASLVRAGPYLWDPAKANPNMVGGTDGSGYNPAREGGEMWTNLQGQWIGTEAPTYVMATTAYRTEGGQDVVYVSSNPQASGFNVLYRYVVGDVQTPGSGGTWEQIGIQRNTVSFHGAGTLDTERNLYIRNAEPLPNTQYTGELAVWDLNIASANAPGTRDIAIELVLADGSPFFMQDSYGLDYDASGDRLLLWKGGETVWEVGIPERDSSGALSTTTWVATPLDSATDDHPTESFHTGVLGRWKYIPELRAFMALEEGAQPGGTYEGTVWLYRPPGWVNPVPEPNVYAMFALGLLVLGSCVPSRLRRSLGSTVLGHWI